MGIRAWPDYLRAAGIKVQEHNNWRNNAPLGELPSRPKIVWHHDASPAGPSPGALDWIIGAYNRQDASAQIWVGYDGTWHFIGSGVAWHTGNVMPGMPGNYEAVGVETDETTGETWSPALLNSLRKGTAAIASAEGYDPENWLHFHKTICKPPGRKSDPEGLELASERRTVRSLMGKSSPAPTNPELDLEIDMDAQTFKQLVRDGFKWAVEDAGGIDPILIDKAVNRAIAGPLAEVNAKLDAIAAKVK